MIGKHAVANALLALTIADLLGVPARDAVRGLAEAEPGAMRGELRRVGDLTLIVDCYNANPQSVQASMDVLVDQGVAARKVAVLGSMLELGVRAPELHDRVLADALERDVDLIVATGGFAQAARRAAMATGSAVGPHGRTQLVVADLWREAYPELAARLRGDEIILLKASRGIALEGIIPLLEADFGPGRIGATVERDLGPRAVEV
jgi:UDP-N-acetylmuramoyl-tripeptide--D-alanyl-D-alanine ligase